MGPSGGDGVKTRVSRIGSRSLLPTKREKRGNSPHRFTCKSETEQGATSPETEMRQAEKSTLVYSVNRH